jgi:hypothetical protein
MRRIGALFAEFVLPTAVQQRLQCGSSPTCCGRHHSCFASCVIQARMYGGQLRSSTPSASYVLRNWITPRLTRTTSFRSNTTGRTADSARINAESSLTLSTSRRPCTVSTTSPFLRRWILNMNPHVDAMGNRHTIAKSLASNNLCKLSTDASSSVTKYWTTKRRLRLSRSRSKAILVDFQCTDLRVERRAWNPEPCRSPR